MSTPINYKNKDTMNDYLLRSKRTDLSKMPSTPVASTIPTSVYNPSPLSAAKAILENDASGGTTPTKGTSLTDKNRTLTERLIQPLAQPPIQSTSDQAPMRQQQEDPEKQQLQLQVQNLERQLQLQMQLNQMQPELPQASQPESRGSKHMGNVSLQRFEGGDQNPIKFWSLFIQYCTLYRFSESETVGMFPLHVSNTVQDWFFSLGEGVRRNLQLLKEAFLERFQRRNLEYSLQHIKQHQSESVNDYINRILAQTADSNVPEAILVSMLVGGLRPDLAAIVMPQVPKTHQQFLAAASIAEKTVQMTTAKPIENLTLQVANIASMEDRLSAMLTDKLSSSVAEMSAIQAQNNQSNGPYQRQNYQQRPKLTYQQRNYQRPQSSSCQGCGNVTSRFSLMLMFIVMVILPLSIVGGHMTVQASNAEEDIHRLNYGVLFQKQPSLYLSREYWLHTFEVELPSNISI
ncbi:uncharacterized protein LOC134697349 isoform X2 [Mytilus trossulus]|uniref:uncharacterized protein LOC134697349 isoform X2 n=1 Tax=Mytilus trossulus TaxID=6551 RepID=UPI003004CD57